MTERFFSVFSILYQSDSVVPRMPRSPRWVLSPGFRFFVKFYSAKHVSVIRQGKGGHLELDCLLHEVADFASAVKEDCIHCGREDGQNYRYS